MLHDRPQSQNRTRPAEQAVMESQMPRVGHPVMVCTYLSLVGWANIEVVNDSGDTRLESKFGVGCPKI